MKQTQILHLIDSAGLYGAERVVLNLLHELKASSFPGVLGCIHENKGLQPLIAKEAEAMGLPVQCFAMGRGFSLKGLSAIRRYMERENVPIVHSHGYKGNIFLGLLGRTRFKRVSTVHGWSKQSGSLKGRLYEALDAISLRRMNKVVAVSGAVKKDLQDKGLPESQIDVIYNGIPGIPTSPIAIDILTGRKKYGLASDAFVIGIVGRLVAVKGHAYVIEAMASIVKEAKNCVLAVAGSGPCLSDLERLVARLNIKSNVKFYGFIHDIKEFLAMIDLFVMPSLSEGLPMALLEAMAVGKPVIASAVGGIPEVIAGPGQGLLVPPADSKPLESAIIALYRDSSYREFLGRNGRLVVSEAFTSAEMSRRYSVLYREVLSRD